MTQQTYRQRSLERVEKFFAEYDTARPAESWQTSFITARCMVSILNPKWNLRKSIPMKKLLSTILSAAKTLINDLHVAKRIAVNPRPPKLTEG